MTRAPRRPAKQRVSDEALQESYARLGSVYKVARAFGLKGSSIHERLQRLGVACDGAGRRFTAEDDARLVRDYVAYRRLGRVATLASEMGRTVPFLSRQARRLGLTAHRYERAFGPWAGMSDAVAGELWATFKATPATLSAFCARHALDDEGFRKRMLKLFPDEWEHVIESKVPAQTMYRSGRQFEYRVRDHLRALGYFVLRSPASRSPIDLVAIRPGEVLFVQCKRSGALPPHEWNALFDLALSVGALPVLAETPTSFGVACWRLTARKGNARAPQPKCLMPALCRGRSKAGQSDVARTVTTGPARSRQRLPPSPLAAPCDHGGA